MSRRPRLQIYYSYHDLNVRGRSYLHKGNGKINTRASLQTMLCPLNLRKGDGKNVIRLKIKVAESEDVILHSLGGHLIHG